MLADEFCCRNGHFGRSTAEGFEIVHTVTALLLFEFRRLYHRPPTYVITRKDSVTSGIIIVSAQTGIS
jgi:hypothetical protein